MPLLSHNANPNVALVASEPGSGNSANTTVPTPTGPSIKGTSGGLRRLEMGRKTTVKSMQDTQDAIIAAVTNHFIAKNKALTSLTPEAQACAMKTRPSCSS
eukprot:15000908-Ditylum_brightwellii.AAC.1